MFIHDGFPKSKNRFKKEKYLVEMAREPIIHPLRLCEFIWPVEFVKGAFGLQHSAFSRLGNELPSPLQNVLPGPLLKGALVDGMTVGPVSQIGKNSGIDGIIDGPD